MFDSMSSVVLEVLIKISKAYQNLDLNIGGLIYHLDSGISLSLYSKT